MGTAGADLTELVAHGGRVAAAREAVQDSLRVVTVALTDARQGDRLGLLAAARPPIAAVVDVVDRMAEVDDHPARVAAAFARADAVELYGVRWLVGDPTVPLLTVDQRRAIGTDAADALRDTFGDVGRAQPDGLREHAADHLDELTALGDLLAEHGGDPVVARALLDGLGPEGVEMALALVSALGELEAVSGHGVAALPDGVTASGMLADALFGAVATGSATLGGRLVLRDLVDARSGPTASPIDRITLARLARVPGLDQAVLVAVAGGVLLHDPPMHEMIVVEPPNTVFETPISGSVELSVIRALDRDPVALRQFIDSDPRALDEVLDPAMVAVAGADRHELDELLGSVVAHVFADVAPGSPAADDLLRRIDAGHWGPHAVELPVLTVVAPLLPGLLAGTHDHPVHESYHADLLAADLTRLLRDMDDHEQVVTGAVLVDVAAYTALELLEPGDLASASPRPEAQAVSAVDEVLAAHVVALAEVADDRVRAQESLAASITTGVGHLETIALIVAPSPTTIAGKLSVAGGRAATDRLLASALDALVLTEDRVELQTVARDVGDRAADAVGRSLWADHELRAELIAAEEAHRGEPFAPATYEEFLTSRELNGLLDSIADEVREGGLVGGLVAERDG